MKSQSPMHMRHSKGQGARRGVVATFVSHYLLPAFWIPVLPLLGIMKSPNQRDTRGKETLWHIAFLSSCPGSQSFHIQVPSLRNIIC